MSELDYQRGRKSIAGAFIRECWDELDPVMKDKVAMVIDRDKTVAMLRQICEEHGDNDWSDNLSLADVIEKHLWIHLENSQ